MDKQGARPGGLKAGSKQKVCKECVAFDLSYNL